MNIQFPRPEDLESPHIESNAFVAGNLYITLKNYERNDFSNPYMFACEEFKGLISLSNGEVYFQLNDTRCQRNLWVDVTDQFTLVHKELL